MLILGYLSTKTSPSSPSVKMRNRLPHNVLSFYTKMYYKQKDFRVTKHNGARASWRSLSTIEKEKFLKKYNEYKMKLKTAYLKEAEPFLKKNKQPKSTDLNRDTNNVVKNKEAVEPDLSVDQVKSIINEGADITPEAGTITPEARTITPEPPNQAEHFMGCIEDNTLDNESRTNPNSTDLNRDTNNVVKNKEAVEPDLSVDQVKSIINEGADITPEAGTITPKARTITPEPPDQAEHFMGCIEDNTLDNESRTNTNREIDQDDQKSQTQILSEPQPPTVKNGKELFYMINSMDVHKSNKWLSLSKSAKSRYGRAVLLLKRDYITKYKKFLESLSPRDLFDYYNKTMD